MEVDAQSSVQFTTSASGEGKPVGEVTRGMAKSGRWWKEPKKPNKTINKVQTLHSDWQRKLKLKEKQQAAKKLQQEIRDKQRVEKEEKVQRHVEQEERKKENQRKAEVVQIIRNKEKLKKLKKKSLRRIEKRDLSEIKMV